MGQSINAKTLLRKKGKGGRPAIETQAMRAEIEITSLAQQRRRERM